MTAGTMEPLTFILKAEKRAVKRVQGGRDEWEPDEEGFLSRWPDNKRPDIGTQRSAVASELARQAYKLNQAQERSGFLDWLFTVDVDAPIHPPCTPECATHDPDNPYHAKEG